MKIEIDKIIDHINSLDKNRRFISSVPIEMNLFVRSTTLDYFSYDDNKVHLYIDFYCDEFIVKIFDHSSKHYVYEDKIKYDILVPYLNLEFNTEYEFQLSTLYNIHVLYTFKIINKLITHFNSNITTGWE